MRDGDVISEANAGRPDREGTVRVSAPPATKAATVREDRKGLRSITVHVDPEFRQAVKIKAAEMDWTMDYTLHMALLLLMEYLNASESERRQLTAFVLTKFGAKGDAS